MADAAAVAGATIPAPPALIAAMPTASVPEVVIGAALATLTSPLSPIPVAWIVSLVLPCRLTGERTAAVPLLMARMPAASVPLPSPALIELFLSTSTSTLPPCGGSRLDEV